MGILSNVKKSVGKYFGGSSPKRKATIVPATKLSDVKGKTGSKTAGAIDKIGKTEYKPKGKPTPVPFTNSLPKGTNRISPTTTVTANPNAARNTPTPQPQPTVQIPGSARPSDVGFGSLFPNAFGESSGGEIFNEDGEVTNQVNTQDLIDAGAGFGPAGGAGLLSTGLLGLGGKGLESAAKAARLAKAEGAAAANMARLLGNYEKAGAQVVDGTILNDKVFRAAAGQQIRLFSQLEKSGFFLNPKNAKSMTQALAGGTTGGKYSMGVLGMMGTALSAALIGVSTLTSGAGTALFTRQQVIDDQVATSETMLFGTSAGARNLDAQAVAEMDELAREIDYQKRASASWITAIGLPDFDFIGAGNHDIDVSLKARQIASDSFWRTQKKEAEAALKEAENPTPTFGETQIENFNNLQALEDEQTKKDNDLFDDRQRADEKRRDKRLKKEEKDRDAERAKVSAEFAAIRAQNEARDKKRADESQAQFEARTKTIEKNRKSQLNFGLIK